MKIAVTGKGGVGKTSFAATLARIYANEGKKVIAVDADPDTNLGLALGFPNGLIKSIVPISQMKDMIQEKTGANKDSYGAFFKLNPRVSDIPDKYSKECYNVSLLVMGSADTGGAGCFCPENVLLKQLTSHLILQRDEIIILDMEAGLEHLGRGTAEGVDAFIVVVEPGERSIVSYRRIKKMSNDLGVKNVFVVGNKVYNQDAVKYIKEKVHDEDFLGIIKYNNNLMLFDREGASSFDNPDFFNEVSMIKSTIEKRLK